jgi:hypothetical protein
MQKKAEFICNSLVALEHILSQKKYAMSTMGFDPGHLTLYATALPSEPKGSKKKTSTFDFVDDLALPDRGHIQNDKKLVCYSRFYINKKE